MYLLLASIRYCPDNCLKDFPNPGNLLFLTGGVCEMEELSLLPFHHCLGGSMSRYCQVKYSSVSSESEVGSNPVLALYLQQAKQRSSERDPINLFTSMVVHALGSVMVAKEWRTSFQVIRRTQSSKLYVLAMQLCSAFDSQLSREQEFLKQALVKFSLWFSNRLCLEWLFWFRNRIKYSLFKPSTSL